MLKLAQSKENPKIIGKKMKDGRYSLSLEYYYGYSATYDENGKRKVKHDRSYESLKLYLYDNPRKPQEKIHNQNTIALAKSIRDEKGQEMLAKTKGYRFPPKSVNVLDYMEQTAIAHKQKGNRALLVAVNNFKAFYSKQFPDSQKLTPDKFIEELMKSYAEYLYITTSGTGGKSTFKRVRQIINELVKEGKLLENPAKDLYCKAKPTKPKEVIGIDECKRLAEKMNEGEQVEIRRAFMFSLETGLRLGETKVIQFSDVDIENNTYSIIQPKTQKPKTNPLSRTAIKILETQKKCSDEGECVFTVPYHKKIKKELNLWMKSAGIDKEITFGCARHSFASNLASKGVSQKTIQELMGHSTPDMAAHYIKTYSSDKRRAVELIDE